MDTVKPTDVVEADKSKPYKTYAAMASAFISSLLLSGVPMPLWVKAILGGIVAGLAVYLTGNPMRFKKSVTLDKPRHLAEDETLF